MKQIELKLADGQSISINPAHITNMESINNEDYVARTHVYLSNGNHYCVIESIREIENLCNSK
jgi:uncharacterized protein YlzI (FlbEa/FlbD family)